MKTAIVTDSNSGISQAEAEQLGISVLPMPFIAGEEVYHEGKNLTTDRFYELLQSDMVLRTSQPSPGEMASLWDNLLESYDEILFIPMSSGLSGTYTSARLLAEDYDGRVEVADARRISITMRHIVLDALAMREAGLSAREMREEIEKIALLSIVYVGVEDLKYLKRGGRISGAAATVGSILNIKPPPCHQGGEGGALCDGARQQALQEARGRGDFEGGAGLLGHRQKDMGRPGGQLPGRGRYRGVEEAGTGGLSDGDGLLRSAFLQCLLPHGSECLRHGGLGALGTRYEELRRGKGCIPVK